MQQRTGWKNIFSLISLIWFVTIMLSSCSPTEKPPCSPTPSRFKEVAVPTLANNLFNQVKGDWTKNLLTVGGSKKVFAVDLFAEETTGTTVKASQQILDIILKQAKQDFPDFVVNGLTTDNTEADYFITGLIRYEPLCNSNATTVTAKKFHSIESSVTEIKTGSRIAEYKVWIQDTIDLTKLVDIPVPEGIDLDDRKLEREIKPEREIEYLTELAPLLNEAELASGKGNYDEAVQSFEKASKVKTDQQQVRIYNGLYWSYFKLGKKDKAEEAMSKLVKAAAKENSLNFYFLFETDSAGKLIYKKQEEYDIWIRQIGKYFERTQECLQIIGHTSVTGPDDYNCTLSKERAITIQNELKDYYSQVNKKTIPIGRGEKECRSCADDDNTANVDVDRRVEFRIVDCKDLNHDIKDCSDRSR